MNKLKDYLFVSECDGHMYDTRKPRWYERPPLRANYARIPQRIENTIQLRAALRNPYAWPGGYELFFITSDGALLCHDCVRKHYRSVSDSIRHNLSDGWRVVGITLDNELEQDESCAQCNKQIHSKE